MSKKDLETSQCILDDLSSSELNELVSTIEYFRKLPSLQAKVDVLRFPLVMRSFIEHFRSGQTHRRPERKPCEKCAESKLRPMTSIQSTSSRRELTSEWLVRRVAIVCLFSFFGKGF